MRGLRKYLTPFAPDQSGAVSVLYELGGIIVICDAGGCTGNVCGFDEPRWFQNKSAVFSAGLRDMDAILGRDDRLVAKLADAADKVEASFAAIIGTPVPAVIGTDYLALKRMSEKKTDLPIMTVDANGMELYDSGEEKAWLALFQTFAKEIYPVDEGRVGILGMTPQDISDLGAADRIREFFKDKYDQRSVCYGMGDGLEEVKKASSVSRNIVVSPAALKTAEYLKKTFGTAYEVGYPLVEELIPDMDYAGKKVLVVHQQVIADSIRKELRKKGAAEIQTASWFMMQKELREEHDVFLRDEDDYTELIKNNDFDLIFADAAMERMTPQAAGRFINVRHFAVSGRLTETGYFYGR